MKGSQQEKYNKYIKTLKDEYGIEVESLDYIFTPTTSPYGTLSGMLRWCFIGGGIVGIILLLCMLSLTGIYQLPVKLVLKTCTMDEKKKILAQLSAGKRFSGDVVIGTDYLVVYLGPVTFLIRNSEIHSIYLEKSRFNFTTKNKKQYDVNIQTTNHSKLRVKTYDSGKIADTFKELLPGISMEYSTEDSDSYYME